MRKIQIIFSIGTLLIPIKYHKKYLTFPSFPSPKKKTAFEAKIPFSLIFVSFMVLYLSKKNDVRKLEKLRSVFL